MGYRRLFIMRKDLHMSPGKLAAQVAHCAEAYWMRGISKSATLLPDFPDGIYRCEVFYDKGLFEEYINGSFVKTICEARNKNHLMKAKEIATSLGLLEDVDFGVINDNCRTELEPEEPDGTTVTGMWFCPLPDEIAHQISKKYQLYK